MAREEVIVGVKVDTKQAQKSLAELEKEQKQYAKSVSKIETAIFNERKKLLAATSKEEEEASKERIKYLQETKKEFKTLSSEASIEVKKLNETMDETTSGFSSGIADIGDSFGALGAPLASAKQGVAALGKGFKALLANPVVLVVAAIVAGLTALYKAFTRSEDGANKMAVAFAYLEGLLIPLIKGAETLANGLYDLFTEPKQAMQDFAQSLEDWVIGKINLVIEGIGFLGTAFKELFSANWSEALDAAAKGLNALDKGLNPLRMTMDSVTESVTKYVDEAGKMAVANAELVKLENQLIKAQRENEVSLAQQLAKREELMNIRDNELLSIDERIEANEELNRIELKQAAESERIANLALDAANLRIDLYGKTTENLQAQADAEKNLAQIQADSLGRQNEFILNRQGLLREKAEYDKADIDFEFEKLSIIEKNEAKILLAKVETLEKTSKLYGKDTIEYKETLKQKELAELAYQQFVIDTAEKTAIKKCENEGGKWVAGVCDFSEKIAKERAATLETAKEEAINLANEVSNAVFEAQAANLEREKEQKLNVVQQTQNRELEIVNARLEKGLINDEQAEQQRLKIEEDSARKSEQIQKEAFKKKQKQDIAAVALDLARQISAIQLNASLNPANAVTFGAAGISQAAILTAGAVATSALQVATIKSQKFEKGGIIEGNSHAEGGVPFTVDGVGGFEAEGGEVIINKRSAAMFRKELSVINQAGGGVKFANGGVVGSDSGAASSDLSSQLQELIEVSKRPTRAVVSETEITNSQSRISNIEARSSF